MRGKERPPHALNNGRSAPISTVAPSIRVCEIANGTNRRSRRYTNVTKIDSGTGDNSRKAMNLASKVKGMNECCNDQTTATIPIARLYSGKEPGSGAADSRYRSFARSAPR